MPGPEVDPRDEEQTDIGTPFKEIDPNNCMQEGSHSEITILRPGDFADYALAGHMLAETKKRISEFDVVMTYELVVNDKRQNLQVVKRHDHEIVGGGLFAAEFAEVGISLIEMDSGMALDLGGRERWAPIVSSARHRGVSQRTEIRDLDASSGG